MCFANMQNLIRKELEVSCLLPRRPGFIVSHLTRFAILIYLLASGLGSNASTCFGQQSDSNGPPENYELQEGDCVSLLYYSNGKLVERPFQLIPGNRIQVRRLPQVDCIGKTIAEVNLKIRSSASSNDDGVRGLRVELLKKQVVDANHIVRIGDVLAIDCPGLFGDFRLPKSKQENCNHLPGHGIPLPVQANGTILVPCLGAVSVEGTALSSVKQKLVDALRAEDSVAESNLVVNVGMFWERSSVESPIESVVEPFDVVALSIEEITVRVGEEGLEILPLVFGRDEYCAPAWGLPFQIDAEGKLELPFLEKTVQAGGLTLLELRSLVANEYEDRDVLVDAYYHINFVEKYRLSKAPSGRSTIQPGDSIAVSILDWDEDPSNRDFFCRPAITTPQDPELPPVFGTVYEVDKNGEVVLNNSLRLKAGGQSSEQFVKLVQKQYSRLNVPMVHVGIVQRARDE